MEPWFDAGRRSSDACLDDGTNARPGTVVPEHSRDLQDELVVIRPSSALAESEDRELDLLRRHVLELPPSRGNFGVRDPYVRQAVIGRPQERSANFEPAPALHPLDRLPDGD